MKHCISLLICVLFLSCTPLIDSVFNNEDLEDDLVVLVKNKSQFQMQNIRLILDGNTYYFSDIAPGSTSHGSVFSYVYDQVMVRATINDGLFSYTPSFINELSLVTKGTYVFEIAVSNYNNGTLAVIRKTL